MSSTNKCPVCGAELPLNSPAGLCIRCVFKQMAVPAKTVVMVPPRMFPRPFGKYELLEEIARGGMGIVYKARQVALNRLVALKMILHGAFATEKDVARF